MNVIIIIQVRGIGVHLNYSTSESEEHLSVFIGLQGPASHPATTRQMRTWTQSKTKCINVSVITSTSMRRGIEKSIQMVHTSHASCGSSFDCSCKVGVSRLSAHQCNIDTASSLLRSRQSVSIPRSALGISTSYAVSPIVCLH